MRIALYDPDGDLLFSGKSLLSERPPAPSRDEADRPPPSSSGVFLTRRAPERTAHG
ncbi:MAG: hypothetical protein KC657_33760 [Myxococcales bacterium]|nr:hypothetical protein [Myxococcales bacterium]